MTSREEVAIAAKHWADRCAKVDSPEENALRDLAAKATSEASSAHKLSLWSRSRYASRYTLSVLFSMRLSFVLIDSVQPFGCNQLINTASLISNAFQ
jgi:hypothetical protein